MLMQEVNVSQTEDLLAFGIVPAAQVVKVHALAQALSDVSEQPAHEGDVVVVGRNESWHEGTTDCV